MDMRIIKRDVCYCAICNDVRDAKMVWDTEQEALVESGDLEEAKQFPGVRGYAIKNADDYSYMTTEICESCMNALIKGVGLINGQKLTGISLSNGIQSISQ